MLTCTGPRGHESWRAVVTKPESSQGYSHSTPDVDWQWHTKPDFPLWRTLLHLYFRFRRFSGDIESLSEEAGTLLSVCALFPTLMTKSLSKVLWLLYRSNRATPVCDVAPGLKKVVSAKETVDVVGQSYLLWWHPRTSASRMSTRPYWRNYLAKSVTASVLTAMRRVCWYLYPLQDTVTKTTSFRTRLKFREFQKCQ